MAEPSRAGPRRIGMHRRARLASCLVALVLTACGHSPSTRVLQPGRESPVGDVVACCPAPANASVSGALVGIGGPAGVLVQHWAGTIHVQGSEFATISTDGRGHFAMHLPAGRYRFTATSPSYDDGTATCHAVHAVVLRAHTTAHVRVICSLK
jgi:hypothetical protein